jgi:hypothetical protein
MKETGRPYSKKDKPDTERQISYILTYMETTIVKFIETKEKSSYQESSGGAHG